LITTVILGASIVCQFVAAFLSLRLIKITGRWQAWSFIAIALMLMGVRRSITFYRILSGDVLLSPDITAELVALCISVLMLTGVILISPIFKKIQSTNKALLYKQFSISKASDSIYWINAEARIIDVNDTACSVLGYSREELLNMNVFDIDTDFSIEDWSLFWQELKAQQTSRFESHHKTKDGHIFPVKITVNYFNYQKSENICAFVNDITEHKQVEKQLLQSQKMEAVGQLTGGIAHDFNNILAAILGYAHLAKDRVLNLGDDKLERYLSEVIDGGKRASKIIDEMLIFSRNEREVKNTIHVNDVVIKTVSLLKGMLPSSIEINVTIEKDIPAIQIDPIQLEQIIMNLCINSMHAMHEVGTLNIGVQKLTIAEGQKGFPRTVAGDTWKRIDTCFCQDENTSTTTTTHSGEYVELWVRDGGSGISSESLEHMFEPFYTTKGDMRGTGMGLAMTHGVMQGSKGHIIVETEEGKGSLFRLLFRASKYTKTMESTAKAEDKISVIKTDFRILLVDDEDPILDFVTEMLSNRGYKVTKCMNSETALSLFEETPEKFNLVITDQTMPKLTGLDLSKRLLAIRADIPIILCSGYSELVDEEKAKSIGIRSYLNKPIDQKQLLQVINDSLSEIS